MSARRTIARVAAAATIALSAATAIAIAATVSPEAESMEPALTRTALRDAVVYVIAWSYIGLTPVLATIALATGHAGSLLTRASYVLLAIWCGFMAWTLSLGF